MKTRKLKPNVLKALAIGQFMFSMLGVSIVDSNLLMAFIFGIMALGCAEAVNKWGGE